MSMTLDVLDGHKYMSLKTFRKSGEEVATPVWFARDGNTLYVVTAANAGKVKRIRNNAQVEVAPSDMRGKLVGTDYQPAQARILNEAESKIAKRALDKKYGLMKRFLDGLARVRGSVWIHIAITPALPE